MAVCDTRLTKTHEILTQKISLTRIQALGKANGRVVMGWEYAPPKKGEGYTIYLGSGKILKTSPVEDIKENFHALMIRTANSIYRIEYVR